MMSSKNQERKMPKWLLWQTLPDTGGSD